MGVQTSRGVVISEWVKEPGAQVIQKNKKTRKNGVAQSLMMTMLILDVTASVRNRRTAQRASGIVVQPSPNAVDVESMFAVSKNPALFTFNNVAQAYYTLEQYWILIVKVMVVVRI